MDYYTKDIASRILQIMQDQGINQNQLAKLLNITQPAVSKYLQGRIPPPGVLLQLSELSGLSMEWILTGKTFKQHVSESQVPYGNEKSMMKKLNALPPPIRKSIEDLIDSILETK